MNEARIDALQVILDEAIAGTDADFGNIQLVEDGTATVRIAVQQGFAAPFLEKFALVDTGDSSSCGRALRDRTQVVVDDVEREAAYDPYRREITEAGVRSVQSTPLISRTGAILGIISTHYRKPRQALGKRLRMSGYYARFAAAIVEWSRLMRQVSELAAPGDGRQGARDLAVEIRSLLANLRENRHNELLIRTLCEHVELRVRQLVQEVERQSTSP